MRYLLLVLVLFSFSCSLNREGAFLRIGFHVSPSTLDPRKASDFVSSTLMCLLYEGLTRNLPDGSVELALAEKVDISEEGLVYIFYLREAFWSDGKPVTAYDLEASWKKGVDPEFPSLSAYLFYPIKYGFEVARGEKSLDEFGVSALNAKTFRVELERPCPYFLSLMAFCPFFPVPLEKSEENIDQMRSLVSNGPFCLDAYLHERKILLRKSESFWDKDRTDLQGIEIQIVPDERTALHLFERNELDWIGGALSPLSLDSLAFLKNKRKIESSPVAATTFCSFNTARLPFQNQKLRRAFSLAIHREEIVEYITQMGEEKATRYIPPILMGGKGKELYPACDPDLARALFKEALFEEKLSQMPPLTLIFRSHSTDKLLAELLQIQWQKVLGVSIQLRQVDMKTHKELLHTRNYDFALSNWIAQVNDPMNILERFRDVDNLKNYPAWQNAEFTKLLDLAGSLKEKELRMECLERAEEILAEEMPLAPIYHWTHASLCQPRVKNLFTTPTGGVLFELSSINAP